MYTADTQTDNIDAMNMDMKLMNELTSSDTVIAPLSPTLFDFDSVSDSCADDVLTLETDDILPDLSTMEDFVDLTEFFVSSAVYVVHFFLTSVEIMLFC